MTCYRLLKVLRTVSDRESIQGATLLDGERTGLQCVYFGKSIRIQMRIR